MRTPQEAFEKARLHLRNADHMLTMTYPLVKDPKMLMAIADNLFKANMEATQALLYHERTQGLPPFHESPDMIIHTFQTSCSKKYNMTTDLISELQDITSARKSAPMEFARKGMFIIAAQDYTMKTLSEQKLKELVSRSKQFFSQITQILSNGNIRSA